MTSRGQPAASPGLPPPSALQAENPLRRVLGPNPDPVWNVPPLTERSGRHLFSLLACLFFSRLTVSYLVLVSGVSLMADSPTSQGAHVRRRPESFLSTDRTPALCCLPEHLRLEGVCSVLTPSASMLSLLCPACPV